MDLNAVQATVVNALNSFIGETLPAVEFGSRGKILTNFDKLQTALNELRSLHTLITDPRNFDGVLNQAATESLDRQRVRIKRRIDRLRARLASLEDLIKNNHPLDMEILAHHLEKINSDTNPAGVIGARAVGDNV
ncbi:unnamed protein product [Eruca vesicaria subsp. sativa]|uniref:Biogenesis of lysosome-related organelles complex 1 subunit 7 n=1 Tax=Eruca vesicaria subsp. sativa TaxID=29727 RepID=A0ABC8KMF2_ERUVS|nr:unnamed protein product [Eruca vesicaria subsp. sativa]